MHLLERKLATDGAEKAMNPQIAPIHTDFKTRVVGGAIIAPGMEHGPRDFRRAGFQGGGSSAPTVRGRRRPENRLAHAERNGDCFSFVAGAIWESVSSVESVDQLLILKSSRLRTSSFFCAFRVP